MKKQSYFGLLILFIICNGTAICAPDASGPTLVLEERIFDAKEVQEGEVINHSFKVNNSGDSPLEIKNVKPG